MAKAVDAILTITRSDRSRHQGHGWRTPSRHGPAHPDAQQPAANGLEVHADGGWLDLYPYVRRRVQEVMGIPVNTNIDPTNAIAVGAAYFAGTKEKGQAEQSARRTNSPVKLRMVYNKTSQESVSSVRPPTPNPSRSPRRDSLRFRPASTPARSSRYPGSAWNAHRSPARPTVGCMPEANCVPWNPALRLIAVIEDSGLVAAALQTLEMVRSVAEPPDSRAAAAGH
mgnify:CR=1 FL=1